MSCGLLCRVVDTSRDPHSREALASDLEHLMPLMYVVFFGLAGASLKLVSVGGRLGVKGRFAFNMNLTQTLSTSCRSCTSSTSAWLARLSSWSGLNVRLLGFYGDLTNIAAVDIHRLLRTGWTIAQAG